VSSYMTCSLAGGGAGVLICGKRGVVTCSSRRLRIASNAPPPVNKMSSRAGLGKDIILF
jgi:hypothetical protein